MTCKHELPDGTCAICTKIPRDRVEETIEDRITSCKANLCNGEIVWATTNTGARMPIDVEPPEDGSGTIELSLGDDGELYCEIYPRSWAGPGMRASHFETCSEPERFRKVDAGAKL